MDDVASFVGDQLNVPPAGDATAVKVVEFPEQITALFTDTVAGEFCPTTIIAVSAQSIEEEATT